MTRLEYAPHHELKVPHKLYSEIPLYQIFWGNPQAPVGELPSYSGSMGYGLYLKTIKHVVKLACCEWDMPHDSKNWAVVDYKPIRKAKLVIEEFGED